MGADGDGRRNERSPGRESGEPLLWALSSGLEIIVLGGQRRGGKRPTGRKLSSEAAAASARPRVLRVCLWEQEEICGVWQDGPTKKKGQGFVLGN